MTHSAQADAGTQPNDGGRVTVPTGGLVALTPAQEAGIEQNACAEMAPIFNSADSGIIDCNYEYANPRPPICGSTPAYGANLIVTTSEGQFQLVTLSSADCPAGDGFYQDETSLQLILCPKSCLALRRDIGASIRILYYCDPGTLVC
jgi:hypothetical protein